MVNYQLGKIYKLISPSGLIYIGSTCEILSKRLGGHKIAYKYYQKHKNKKITSFILFDEDIDNIDIVLIENYPCNSKDELHARERYYIDSLKCVNKNKPHRTQKEWREENKEYKSQIDKEYYEKNKEYFFQKQKKYYEKNKEKIKEYNKEYSEKRKKLKEDNITL